MRAGQTPREDLEKITTLQEKVIQLENENAQLKIAQQDASSPLAKGADRIHWTVNLRDVKLNNERAPQADFQIDTTWDDAFRLIFPGDKSEAGTREIQQAIALFILESAPEDAISAQWRQEMGSHITYLYWNADWQAVTKIRTDLQRQFSGLGLIQEQTETRYTSPTFGGAGTPTTVRLWKLTNKGAAHLALICRVLLSLASSSRDGS